MHNLRQRCLQEGAALKGSASPSDLYEYTSQSGSSIASSTAVHSVSRNGAPPHPGVASHTCQQG